MNHKIVISLLLAGVVLVSFCGCITQSTGVSDDVVPGSYRTVIDSRGLEVVIPSDIKKVVTISDGMVEGVMTVLGVEHTIVGVGSSCIQRNFNYTYPTTSGESYEYRDGMNPVTYLNRWIMDLPRICESNAAVNFETLSAIAPDVVIMRVGSCSVRYIDDESVTKSIDTIESLGIPLVVIYGPSCYEEPDLSKISDEINIIGDVFNDRTTTERLADYLEEQVKIVSDRTQNVVDDDKPEVMVFGLSPMARKGGGCGQVFGLDTIESYFITDICHAKNSFDEPGNFKTVSEEQVLSRDPDVIVLCTASGYHPPEELYSAPYYQNLQELSAVKNRRVSALPWTPCNCAKRLEYPIDVMVIAKASYPELFEDIELEEWLLDFYQNVYGVDTATAKELRSTQWMDWCVTKCPTCAK
ncbi:MAG: ABC transporter substrate-binding protein [Methanogenium sp.]|jgi:iron complex transport system substrate-binding protein